MLKRKFWNVAFVLAVCLSSGCCRFYSWWCDRPYHGGGCYGPCYGPPQCGCGPSYAPPNGCYAPPPPNYGCTPSNYAPAAGPSAAPASQHGGQ